MKIIKRNGSEVPFDITKIITAVTKASDSVSRKSSLTQEQILSIANDVTEQCQALNRAVSVEEIQDMVENKLMDIQAHDVARHYITYRYVQSLKRQTNTTDERILSLIECQNEEVKQENANKNPTVNSVQRDYMAGEISKDLTARLLLDPEIVKAHNEGLIHFHDSDYFAQHMHNCDLVNLEDMLQNGTVISGTYIEKPHSFSTACNIATQIIAQVASNQYGGQSISLTHLAPFVDVSRKKIAAEVEVEMAGLDVSAERKKEIVERRLRSEINRGVQTIQYQVVTLMTTNGQAPFITVFMYLGEARNPQEKADLAIIIEETIRQRYQGVKNEAGVWITPAFPKLIYVLEEDNIRPGTPYYYLTELAAKCTAKRMVPDYISEKKMLELKVDKNGEGHCYMKGLQKDDYWLMAFPVKNLKEGTRIAFEAAVGCSGSGARYYALEYSADGTNWFLAEGAETVTGVDGSTGPAHYTVMTDQALPNDKTPACGWASYTFPVEGCSVTDGLFYVRLRVSLDIRLNASATTYTISKTGSERLKGIVKVSLPE